MWKILSSSAYLSFGERNLNFSFTYFLVKILDRRKRCELIFDSIFFFLVQINITY